LQYALRKVLGPHVEQSGSLVNDKKLRFDFTHFKQITDEQLARVEEIVNECIQNNDHIKKEIMELKDAKRQNALAFFKEKYSNRVRVISIGNYSKELCGGTHIDSTGQIGLFKIVHESSIASGIRRIEAVTAKQALDYMNNQQEMLDEIKQLLKSDSKNLVDNVKKIIKENKSLKKEIDSLKINISKIELQEALDEAKIIKGTKITIHKFDKVDMDNLRKLNDMIKQKVDSCINILASVIENKAIVIVGLSDDLIHKGLNANKIIQKINQHLQSKGGGRSDLAQAGSGDPSKLKAAFDKIYNYLEKRMNEDTA
jgi:alanyl-tRNA synthetase